MAAIKEKKNACFLSRSAFTVDKTNTKKMPLFIYLLLLSFKCTKSTNQSVALMCLYNCIKYPRGTNNHCLHRGLLCNQSSAKTQHFVFIGIYGHIYCPSAGTTEGLLGWHMHTRTHLPASLNYQFMKIAFNSETITFQTRVGEIK